MKDKKSTFEFSYDAYKIDIEQIKTIAIISKNNRGN